MLLHQQDKQMLPCHQERDSRMHTNAHTEKFCSSCSNATCPRCTLCSITSICKQTSSMQTQVCLSLILSFSRYYWGSTYRSWLCIFSIVAALLSSCPLALVLACIGQLSAGASGMPGCTHTRNQLHTLQGLQSFGRECTAVACQHEGVAVEG